MDRIETVRAGGREWTVGMEPDGILTVIGYGFGDDPLRREAASRYPHLAEAQERRQAALAAEQRRAERAEHDRREAERRERQAVVDERIAQCRGHRAIRSKHRTVGWSHCVSGRAGCDAAHGAITVIDRCRCGAVRRTESNGCHSASSGWGADRSE